MGVCLRQRGKLQCIWKSTAAKTLIYKPRRNINSRGARAGADVGGYVGDQRGRRRAGAEALLRYVVGAARGQTRECRRVQIRIPEAVLGVALIFTHRNATLVDTCLVDEAAGTDTCFKVPFHEMCTQPTILGGWNSQSFRGV